MAALVIPPVRFDTETMNRPRFLRWPVLLLALGVIAIGLAAFARPDPEPALMIDDSYSPPQPVSIAGYTGDAMEPFLTRDGRWLLFNTRNGPKDQTDLMVAKRIDDTHFTLVGPLTGANSGSLDGVASVDRAGHFFFVSNRDYDRSGNTLWTGIFADGQVRDARPLVTDFTPRKLLRLNIDLEVSADGNELYVAENRWDLFRRRPGSSHLAVANRSISATGQPASATNQPIFVRNMNSDALFSALRTGALDYAPATSTDRLTFYFTRWQAGRSGAVPHILVSRRATTASAWGSPRLLAAASGFVEGPTVTPDGCGILYHAKVGEAYRLFLVRRKSC